VGKGKRADVYLEVRKRRGAYIFLMKQVPVQVTYRRSIPKQTKKLTIKVFDQKLGESFL
jgi:anti-sigma regulatory factor (Ser/Thr protein kinase)